MTSDRSADPLPLLVETTGLPVAPHVARRLARQVSGDPAALLQLAPLLGPERLAGRAPLPDPLPAVPALRDAVAVPACPEARRLLRCAVLAVTARADVLLPAADGEVALLRDPAVAAALHVHEGRFRLRDARVRAVVHAASDLDERTAAHAALATAARAVGEPGVALWHTARRVLTGDELLADGLLELAEVLLGRGDVEAALGVAREATSHGSGERRARAFLAAGRAALWCGYPAEARGWARRARGCGVVAVERGAEAVAAVVEALDGGPVAGGSGPGAVLARLVEPALTVAVSPQDRAALRAVADALVGVEVDLGAADALLGRAVAAARPSLERPGPWTGVPGALSPLAEAHLRVAQALLLACAGETTGATGVLQDAVVRLPVPTVARGLGAAVALQLDHERRAGPSVSTLALQRVASTAPEVAAAVAALVRITMASASVPGEAGAPALAADAARQTGRRAAGGGAPTWSGDLTAREVEVATLVADGRTNREVAEELCVSVRTVEVHLGRVYRKLGVRSRAELVVRALRSPSH